MRKEETLAAWILPDRTALMVIDMQADFAAVPGAKRALANANRLVKAARNAGVLCIFTRLQTRAQTDSPVWRERLRRRGRDAKRELAVCREGTPGARFVGPQPRPSDLVIAKRRYSAFSGTELDAVLRARACDTLLVCGLTTECCVDASVRDAFEHDFHVFVARDACAGGEKPLHDAALKTLEHHCALLLETGAVLRAWRTRSVSRASNIGSK